MRVKLDILKYVKPQTPILKLIVLKYLISLLAVLVKDRSFYGAYKSFLIAP